MGKSSKGTPVVGQHTHSPRVRNRADPDTARDPADNQAILPVIYLKTLLGQSTFSLLAVWLEFLYELIIN